MSACLLFLAFLSDLKGLASSSSGPEDFLIGEEEQPAPIRQMLAIKTTAGPAVLSKDTGIFSRRVVKDISVRDVVGKPSRRDPA